MIDAYHHVQLDGVNYKLAQDSEGQHYQISYEPLRPPNAVTVQGENSQKFQARPDVLLWNWTDWSGGEGLRKWDATQPSRSWQLNACRAFDKPGELSPGYYVRDTLDNGEVNDLQVAGAVCQGLGTLYMLDKNGNTIYTWNDTDLHWDAGQSITGPVVGSEDQAVGDEQAIYWITRGTNNVWQWTGSNPAVKISDTLIDAGGTYIAQAGAYVYVYRPASGKVWEIAKTGASESLFDDFSSEAGAEPRGQQPMTTLDGKVYVMVTHANKTMVRELTPTSAAATGSGSEIARIHGFEGEAIWSHSGTLFMIGRYESDSDVQRAVLYLTPGQPYGSLGVVREGDTMGVPTAADHAGRMLDHFWVQRFRSATDNDHALMQVDAISGGIANIAINTDGAVATVLPSSIATHKGAIFWSVQHDAGTKRIMRAAPDEYAKDASAISPWTDFEFVGLKNLNTITLSCKALPADWILYVDYATNSDETYTNAITLSSDGEVDATATVTTDSATVEFHTLQIRIRFEWVGSGVPTSGPTVLGVGVKAQVVKKVKVTNLLLDLNDDLGGSVSSRSGSAKVDAIQATIAKDTAVDFKDGYTHRDPGQYDQSDVYVDSGAIVLDYPSEGYAAVTLREVV